MSSQAKESLGFPRSTFELRRTAAFERLDRGVMVLPAAPVLRRSNDTEHRYRPDSELFFLTGATEPATVAVLVGGEEPRYVLFVADRNPKAELWAGERLGPERAEERYRPDETFGLSDLGRVLPELLQQGNRIHFRLGRRDPLERMVMDALVRARSRGARAGTGPRGVVDPGEVLDDLRLVKDPLEVAHLRAAADLTVQGHRAGLAAVKPGVGEWAVQARIDQEFRVSGTAGSAFPTIVAGGANACVLHYQGNRDLLHDGSLVLVDAGAELNLYNGDLTRTVPVNGAFSTEQRAVYAVVEEARAAALESVRPDATAHDVHLAAARILTRGLVDLGVLAGPLDALVEEEAFKEYFPHQTSHWLGLDVHDPGDYARDGQPRRLRPGMVLAVEPGLYFSQGANGPARRFAGTGVRIEDDVLVTESGCENLTGALPTAPDEVESLVGTDG